VSGEQDRKNSALRIGNRQLTELAVLSWNSCFQPRVGTQDSRSWIGDLFEALEIERARRIKRHLPLLLWKSPRRTGNVEAVMLKGAPEP
jgi:hypothetical protein